MCNIAAYIGNRAAAPILIDMLRRQEGWDAGFYTGLATLHGGTLHHAKQTGDLATLLQSTNAASLPGSVGMIHGRSPSGGGDAWAHPFSAECGTASLAYVANGCAGCFSDQSAALGECAAALARAGHVFTSHQAQPVANYPLLPGGGCVHMSDVMAHQIAAHLGEGFAPDDAMNAAFCEIPAEIVGLALSPQTPECIAWSRINMPMFVAFAPHGAYLATTPQAFPADAGEATLLPACCGGLVYCDHLTVKPYKNPPVRVAPLTPRVLRAAYSAIEQALFAAPQTLPELRTLVNPLFEPAACYPLGALVYSVLDSLEKEGRLSIVRTCVPGMRADLTAPHFAAALLPRS